MARLKDKFTIEEIKEFKKVINEIHYNSTHYKTRSTATDNELQLINTIDYLVRVPGMLCDVIEQELEGHIETYDPHGYTDGKLRTAERFLESYLKLKNIDLDD